MPSYIFLCTSERREFVRFDVLDPPLEFSVPLPNSDTLRIRLFLYGGSSFTVEATCGSSPDISAIADIVRHVLAGLYDSAGLSEGVPSTIRLEGFSEAGSRKFAQLSQALPRFADTIRSAGLQLNDWMVLSVGSPQLRAALRDIRLAMQTPGEAAVHCFRAIERVRQAFSTSSGDRKATWDRLREALNVSRAWLDTYTAHATAVRHGELLELPLEERNRCFAQAATVVIRYAAYLKRGKNNLPSSTFPLLT
jgi:hypothetical protein